MIRCRVADMSESLLCCFAFICLEICLHLLSRLAPISVAVVPHWERQATGFSQTGRRAELPNHIPSLPTTVSISLLSSQLPPSTFSVGNRLFEAGWGDDSAGLCLELLVFLRRSWGHLSVMPATVGCACFWPLVVSLLSFLEQPTLLVFSHLKTYMQHWCIMEIWDWLCCPTKELWVTALTTFCFIPAEQRFAHPCHSHSKVLKAAVKLCLTRPVLTLIYAHVECSVEAGVAKDQFTNSHRPDIFSLQLSLALALSHTCTHSCTHCSVHSVVCMHG